MFPAPSPSTSQFLFGGATPGTMEFQKTALSAARKSHPPLIPPHSAELKSESNTAAHANPGHGDAPKPRQPSDPFNADSAHNAANGLYLLAQMGGAPNAYQQSSHITNAIQPNTMDSSPNLAKRAVVNNAASAGRNSAAPNSIRGVSEMSNDRSESSLEPDSGAPSSGGRKGRNTRAKATAATTGKRKNDAGSDTSKANASKKSKNTRSAMSGSDDAEGDEDEDQQNELRKDGKKMTDEEKRKNFLERNRYVHSVLPGVTTFLGNDY
jgi:ATF/CREB family transcription factor